jgi:hypothetical protein
MNIFFRGSSKTTETDTFNSSTWLEPQLGLAFSPKPPYDMYNTNNTFGQQKVPWEYSAKQKNKIKWIAVVA